MEKHGAGNVPKERAGVTMNRRDLIALPVPSANLLWRDLHVREGYRDGDKTKTRNVLISIDVEGIDEGMSWKACMEFDYANEESFYCRSPLGANGTRLEIPWPVTALRAFFSPDVRARIERDAARRRSTYMAKGGPPRFCATSVGTSYSGKTGNGTASSNG